MNRTASILSILVLLATSVSAGTFNPAPYLVDNQVDVLSRTAANDLVGKDLFGEPYATVVVGNVDIYDKFPYLEAHYFQIVSDPVWNRLLLGEIGHGMVAYDGKNGSFGELDSPRGLSSDGMGRIYVADTGNNRVMVFQTFTEFDRVQLAPLFVIDGLNDPYDVAYSDGGTPYDDSDDRLYVANTGRNEVVLYTLNGSDAQLSSRMGDLGSGMNRFAGPTAITVGRRDGAHSDDIYVSDAHNGRIVQLRDNAGSLEWRGEKTHDLGTVTSLDTDHHGNLYAAAPHAGSVSKFSKDMAPIADYQGEMERPRSFHVPFANVTDHRTGEQTRSGQGSGIVVEEWGGDNGIRLLDLGVEINGATQVKNEGTTVRMTLTDHADVTARIVDSSGRVIAQHNAGVLDAGEQTIRFDVADFVSAWDAGDYRMSIEAVSTYSNGAVSKQELMVTMNNAGSPPLPASLTALGNAPNPFNPVTTIRFVVPAGPTRAYSVRIYDVSGRLIRELAAGTINAGFHNLEWDGRSNNGGTVGSGIYLYRVEAGQEQFTGKMVLLK